MSCKDFIHPFQHDPGTSQAQRVMSDLLSGSAKIDSRTLADLLDYFVQLSKQVNYYDENLGTRDWLPFFQDALPFTITSMLKFDQVAVVNKIAKYRKKFNYRPTKAALQTLVRYEYKMVIEQLNTWYTLVKNRGLIIESSLQSLISKNGQGKVKSFITNANNAVRYFRIKPVDFSLLVKDGVDSNVWGLTGTDLIHSDNDFFTPGKTKRQLLLDLYNGIADLSTSFLDIIHSAMGAAELSLLDSFENLREDLKQRYTPHHALLFAFLKLFQHLQDGLNEYTKKHLDFFYQQVLKLVPRNAVADHAHLIFDIQKTLDAYPLKAGLMVKDSKDNNKQDILFSLDEDLIVNKAQVKDLRTLFVNNHFVQDKAYVQGVYMAPVATKADGIDKDFANGQPNSWPTVGGHYSKYIDPENKFVHPYPNARIAFVMASPVLLLNEGTRKIDIKLTCTLKQNYCLDIIEEAAGDNNPCCDDDGGGSLSTDDPNKGMPLLYDPNNLFTDVQSLLNETYYYINRDLIAQAVKLGISSDIKKALEKFLTIPKTKASNPEVICYCDEDIPLFESTITSDEYTNLIKITDPAYTLLLPIFPPQKALNISFSGEKAWIVPKNPTLTLAQVTPSPNLTFTLLIEAILDLDEPAVTFYNKDALKEDIDVDMPVVKVELNDKIKLLESPLLEMNDPCCLRDPGTGGREVSVYHFFRNVLISDTSITVNVCGLKNFIVQNDESLQDVNKPVYPFGTRPAVIGFDAVNPAAPGTKKNLVGPNFFIGSQEIFGKVWTDIFININWKDKPGDFHEYYKAYYRDPVTTLFGLDQDKTQINIAVLQEGKWKPEKYHALPGGGVTGPNNNGDFENRKLFVNDGPSTVCITTGYDQTIYISNAYFTGLNQEFLLTQQKTTKYEVDSYYGFIRLNLQNQDFLHKDYSYVLARQMMAFGKLPDQAVADAVYYDPTIGGPVVFDTNLILEDLKKSQTVANFILPLIKDIDAQATVTGPGTPIDITSTMAAFPDPADTIRNDLGTTTPNQYPPPDDSPTNLDLKNAADKLAKRITTDVNVIAGVDKYQAIIPNEPWTPIIQNISIDYSATATMTDIDLIHLYPYPNTYKKEELQLTPPMFPTFCDEGTLYIGLENVKPGNNVSFLFQLAEATSDTEDDPEDVQWHYLDNNTWKELRTGFEVLEDASNNLSTSGIIKIAVPGNISNANTVLPAGLYWIKATIGSNSGIVSETIAVCTQAVKATFANNGNNDVLRLNTPLEAGALSRLNVADANVKSVSQPYGSFGGRVPESESYFYVHVSEMLRHKGRAIQKFDYERLALDICPQVFKAKCINHSFGLNAHQYDNDYPMAPGYVLLAVIPDMNQLNASGSYEPRVPLSMLEALETKLRLLTSPFVRLRAMNPRYEKVDFCLRVKLLPGKDESFYKQQLKTDIQTFMAPWAVGSYDKLDFGQVINRSDFIRFLEGRDYIDYITEFLWRHDEDEINLTPVDQAEIYPITPRSILIAGYIDVCILSNDCLSWDDNDSCPNGAIKIVDYCKE